MQKVFLVVPPTGRYIREDRCQTPLDHMTTIALRTPVDLLYMGACFEKGGANCRLVDYPAEERDAGAFLQDVREFGPDLLVMSVTTPGLPDDMAVALQVKEACPDVVIAAKGAHFNTLDEAALREYPGLDLCFRGEYEPACEELARGMGLGDVAGLTFRARLEDPTRPAEELVRTPDRPFVEDLDCLPLPARHLVDNRAYVRPDTGEPQTTIVTNRGCPFSCVYCLANQVAGRRNRARSVGNILAEIEQCVEEFGIRNFLFRSDLFTANRAWVLELCSEIERRGLDIAWACNSRVDTLSPEMLAAMRRAGCWIIAFGIESGSQEILDKIGKKTDLDQARTAIRETRRAGILSSTYFLVGLPWDRPETLRANERFARELNPDIVEIFYVYPFPGSPLYAECVRLGLLAEGTIPRQAYDGPAYAPLHMTREELVAARNHALRDFYLRPGVIVRTLLRAKSPRELWNYLRYGVRQLREFL